MAPHSTSRKGDINVESPKFPEHPKYSNKRIVLEFEFNWTPLLHGFYRLFFSTNASLEVSQVVHVNSGELGEYAFAVFGDNRPAGRGEPQPEAFQRLIECVNLIHPYFAVDCGDLVHGYGASIEELGEEYADFIKAVSRLEVPLVTVVGNHDVRTSTKDPVSGDEYAEHLYMALFGRPYYSFNVGRVHFIVLDSDVVGSAGVIVGTSQGEWLEEDLMQAENYSGIVVFVHRPIVTCPITRPAWSTRDAEYLEHLLQARNVSMFFQGHDHLYYNESRDSTTYYVTGRAGAPIRVPVEQGGVFPLLLVEVRDGVVEVKFIPINCLAVEYSPSSEGIAEVIAARVKYDFTKPLIVWGEACKAEAHNPERAEVPDASSRRVRGWGEK